MDDDLVLAFIRLVRNGRSALRRLGTFTVGDLILAGGESCAEEEQTLQLHRRNRGPSSKDTLVVYIKGTVVEIWKFEDFRIPAAPHSSPNFVPQGLTVTEKEKASLNMLVRVVYAYLRVHELFIEIMNADPGDVVLKVLGDMSPPTLEEDTSKTMTWAVEKLASITVTYNSLWRSSSPYRVAPLLPSPPVHSCTPSTLAVPVVGSTDRKSGPPPPASDSVGSVRSLPTPYIASMAAPGSVGSGRMSASQPHPKSPTCGPSEMFLPLAAVSFSESMRHFRGASPGAVALAAAALGTRTPAVRGYTLSSLPNFGAVGLDSSDDEDGNSELLSMAGQIHDLLEICDGAVLTEAFVEMSEVLNVLDKKILDI